MPRCMLGRGSVALNISSALQKYFFVIYFKSLTPFKFEENVYFEEMLQMYHAFLKISFLFFLLQNSSISPPFL